MIRGKKVAVVMAGNPLKASFDADALELWRSLVEPLKAAQERAAIPAPPAPLPQIEVVNKVPTTILSVLREQFRLMQHWLEPLNRQSATVGTEV